MAVSAPVRTWPAVASRGWLRAAALALALRSRPDAIAAMAVGLVALAAYDATLTPSLSYLSPDGNELATVAATLGLAHPTGYPLYTWLGKAFTYLPVGDAAHRVNLMSAMGAAGACAVVVLILRELRVPRAIAAGAALFLAFSPTLWSQATISEVYAPNVFFVALEVYLLLLWGRHQRDPVVARHGDLRSTLLFAGWALTFSLSAGMHLSGLGFGPAFATYILLVNRRVIVQPWVLVPAVSVFAAGLLQFLWVPVRYAMGEPSPDPLSPVTLDGFLRYTIHAFPQFTWAYPLELQPDRFIVYGRLVEENFTWAGIVAAIAGAAAMAVVRPRTFILLALMWAVHVVFFMGYRAQDLEVFFIPAHFLLVLSIAFGASSAWRVVERLPRWSGILPAFRSGPGRVVAAMAVLFLVLLPAALQFATHFRESDRSDHTEINDFYRQVFAILPENAALVGAGGVFGYDMFYYPFVYGVRPDVAIPASRLNGLRPVGVDTSDREVFSVSPEGAGGRGLTVGAPAAGAWSVPVLVAPAHEDPHAFIRRSLVLYRQQAEAPTGLLVSDPAPGYPVEVEIVGNAFLGADLSTLDVARGDVVHIRLYWRSTTAVPFSLRLGNERAAWFNGRSGFGLLEALPGVPGSRMYADDFDFVVLRSTPRGAQPLVVNIGGIDAVVATLEVR